MTNNYQILILFLVSLTSSCLFKAEEFSSEELKWTLPFNKTDTAIFKSEKGELDSIIFKKAIKSSEKVRHIERGFYNKNDITIPYEFTKGSYHQSALMSDGENYYDQDFFYVSKTSAGFSDFEITFIGTIFSRDELDEVQLIDEENYFFDSEKAMYTGMNVVSGIKNFKFNIRLGVTEFVDDRNIRWTRE